MTEIDGENEASLLTWARLIIISAASFWCQAVVTEERYAITDDWRHLHSIHFSPNVLYCFIVVLIIVDWFQLWMWLLNDTRYPMILQVRKLSGAELDFRCLLAPLFCLKWWGDVKVPTIFVLIKFQLLFHHVRCNSNGRGSLFSGIILFVCGSLHYSFRNGNGHSTYSFTEFMQPHTEHTTQSVSISIDRRLGDF